MHFRRLRVSGFKSFVDPTELRIDEGLTGVVGPNGCGKSNILEALRWVMGESSPKSMRGGGMEDVIFAGTSSRPSRDVADVTLLIDNSQRKAPAAFNDSDELEVTRRIERGLGSAYRINGKDVRQKDVQLLFADAATGAHSPALVSQGRIGAIISAKPQERRLMLEEAAGIAGLHVRRKEAEQRLRAAESNLARLDDVLKSMESQVAALKRQARQAERYRHLSDRIRGVEARLLFARWKEAAASAESARAAVGAAEQAVTDATRDAARLATAQSEAAAGLPALREAEATAAAALQRLAQARDSLAAELAAVERRQSELAQSKETTERDLVREASLAEDAISALNALEQEAEQLSARIAQAREHIAPAQERVRSAEVQASSDERVLAARIEAQASAQAQRRAAEAAVVGAKGRRDRVRNEAERLAREQAALGEDAETSAQADEAEAERLAALEAIAKAAQRVDAAEAQRAEIGAQMDQLQRTQAEARGALAALEAEAASLTRALAAPKSANAPGVVDQLSVDAGYEKALAAALGDDLSAPVGHSEEARSWLGAVLGSNDPALPAGVSPLSNFVRAPSELARRLAQVGVVDAGQAASLIGQLATGQRLVSRDGQLWRWDGFCAKSGGNAAAAAERMAQRNRLSEVESELPQAQAAVDAAQAALTTARQAADAAQAEERAGRQARAEAERVRDAAAAKVARLVAELERRKSRSDALASSVQRISEELQVAEEDVVNAEKGLAAVPDLENLARESNEARAKAEASRNALANARAEHANLARSLESDERRATAVTQERENWRTRQSGSAAQRVELEGRRESIVAEMQSLAQEPARISERQGALAGELSAAEAKRREAADALAGAESALKEVDAHVRASAEALAQAREERARLAASVEHLDERRAEAATLIGERFHCPPPLLPEQAGFAEEELAPAQELNAELERLNSDRERLGPVNLRAETELEEIEGQRLGSENERVELEQAIARLRGSIGSLNREGRARLLEAFQKVDAHFRELFTSLFGGGQAHLALIESDDPLEAGLEIMAQPPGKKLQAMTLLSGGEQALTACALIFALFLTNPAPICVLDEVDAPLDDANVERFCDLLDRMTQLTDTRFLIVSHNAVTMSRMHRLFGVTMGERGVSQLVSVDLARAEMLLAAE